MSASALASRKGTSEHQVLPALCEWQSRTFPGIELTPEGRALAKRLASGGEGRLDVTELRDGLRVGARSWVGVVRLDGVEIRIVPKLAGDQLGLVRLLEMVTGLDGLSRLAGEAGLEFVGESLLDLVALLFAESCQDLLKRGLFAGYVEREEALPLVRGRILFDRQLLDRFGQLDRIECRFDELEHDVDENRLLAAALEKTHRHITSARVRRRLARLRAIFEPICDTDRLDLGAVRKGLVYDRLNAHYEQAHQLAWMLLDGLGVDDLLSSGSSRCFAFLLDMNVLFERFIELLVRRSLPSEYRVQAQASQRSIIWNETAQRHYSRVVPDLLVDRLGQPSARIAIDAKYKLCDERRFDSGDIYQTFLYAYALASRPGGGRPASLILFPSSTGESKSLRLRIRPRSGRGEAEIVGLGVSIPAAIEELGRGGDGRTQERLRDVIEEVMTS